MYETQIREWASRAKVNPTPSVITHLIGEFFRLVDEEILLETTHPVTASLARFRGSHDAPLCCVLEFALLQSLSLSEGLGEQAQAQPRRRVAPQRSSATNGEDAQNV